MNNIKELVISRESALILALVGAATVAPLFHSQLVTGTIVNATLFAAVVMVGFRTAATVAIVPSLIALAVGTLPLVMAPMLPFIMASNIALAGIFSLIKKTGYWPAAIAACLVKFGVLVLSANIVLATLTHGKLTVALASMMGWPQLITAVLGVALAFAVVEIKSFKKQ